MNQVEYLIRKANNDKICATCKHFQPHYVRIRSGASVRFDEIMEGHCMNGKRFKNMKSWKSCDEWKGKAE